MTTTQNGLLASHFSNRRRHQTSVDDTLNDLSASFLYLMDQSPSHDSRKALKDSEDVIKMHYHKIHLLIDSIDEHLTLKLEHHEQEIFSIVWSEIDEMREETREMIEKLNKVIKRKNTEDALW